MQRILTLAALLLAPLAAPFAGDAPRTETAIIKQGGQYLTIGETDCFHFCARRD
jgi:hypothetical protein